MVFRNFFQRGTQTKKTVGAESPLIKNPKIEKTVMKLCDGSESPLIKNPKPDSFSTRLKSFLSMFDISGYLKKTKKVKKLRISSDAEYWAEDPNLEDIIRTHFFSSERK